MIDPLKSAKRSFPPEQIPGAHHPVIAAPDTTMCPDKQRLLQHAMSDSYSAGWVNDVVKKV